MRELGPERLHSRWRLRRLTDVAYPLRVWRAQGRMRPKTSPSRREGD